MTLNLPDSIKFVITDFDGIVTDNCVYIDSKGEMTRKLNFKDVMAFSILRKNGYHIGIISGEKNSAIEILAKKFNIEEVHQGIRIKIDVIKSIVERYNLKEDEFVYIGDDITTIFEETEDTPKLECICYEHWLKQPEYKKIEEPILKMNPHRLQSRLHKKGVNHR